MSTYLATGIRAAVDALLAQDYPDREVIPERPFDRSHRWNHGCAGGIVVSDGAPDMLVARRYNRS